MATISATLPVRAPSPSLSVSSLRLIGLCFVLSGATGLIYEILWARMLGLVFGATTFAISAVLAAFMGGLALGSACAGRLGARIERPLRAYGIIEIGIALYALAVPMLFRLVDHLYALAWEQFRPGFYAFSLWRFLLSCAVLIVPTTLMGATLPVLSAALLLRSPARTPTSIARLYTCNLTGAICGTLAAGFLLLPWLGVRATIWTAAAINVVVGLAACIIDLKGAGVSKTPKERREVTRAETLPGEGSERAEPHVLRTAEQGTGAASFWLACAAVSGFVTISTQVAWTRVLTMVIGSSTYAFSIVVALFLLGLSGGAYVVGRQRARVRLRHVILKVELATAVSLVMSIWVVNRMPGLLYNMGLNFRVGSWLGLLALQAFVAAMLILIPAFLMGMVMPLVLVRASSAGNDSSVGLVGRSYAVNTLGAIAGAFMTGFIFIPKFNTRFTILFAASLCVIVAGFAYTPARHNEKTINNRRVVAAGLTFVLILALFTGAPGLNLADLSIGAYDGLVRVLARSQYRVEDEDQEKRGAETHSLLMYEEGPTATVSVREDWGVRSMAINGRTNASDNASAHGDMPTQVMLGQLPILLAPRTDKGLIVGFASGVSVGSMLQSPIKSLTAVELEPKTIDASRFFEHVNNRPLEDPRLRLVIDDARSYLRVNPERYDMIVSEPSHPWVPGVANLFTREFFELGHSRLNTDGVFVQWLQIYQLSTGSLRSVLATYTSVFPHVMVFRVGGVTRGKDLLLVGSRVPLTLEHLSERMSDPRVAAELARVGIRQTGDITSWYVCDETSLSPALMGAVINTDDNMHVENRTPREAFLPLMETNAAWIEALGR